MTTDSTPKREQLAFNWNPGEKDYFTSKLEAWQETSGQKKSARDYILWLIDQVDRSGKQTDLAAELAGLGIDQILAAHFTRRSAEDRLIGSIADTVKEAKAKAEAEVKAELDSLTSDTALFKAQIKTAQEEKANLKAKIEELEIDTKTKETEIVSLKDALKASQEKAELEALRAENTAEELGSVTSAYTQEIEHQKELEETILDLKDQAIAQKTEVMEKTQDIASLTAKLEAAEAKSADLSKKLEEANNKIKALEEKTNTEISALKNTETELQKSQIRIAELTAKLESEHRATDSIREAMQLMAKMAPSPAGQIASENREAERAKP